jgi:hypothetical protein
VALINFNLNIKNEKAPLKNDAFITNQPKYITK